MAANEDLTTEQLADLEHLAEGSVGAQVLRAALQVLAGAVPIVGGALGAGAGAWSEHD